MEFNGMLDNYSTTPPSTEEDTDIKRGPWTVEEDLVLVNYIANHGEGRWNSLARCAGLKRTGKSCRLRWLNYLRPDVRRGNITPEEQLLILELHSRWGNRWSKIAQQLPGRTDNEIKNYWRTRVQKHAKQLQCDVNSKQFKDVMRYLWIPRLLERIRAASGSSAAYHHLPAAVYSGDIGQQPESSSVGAATSSDSQPSHPVTVPEEHYGLPAAASHGIMDDRLQSPGGYGYGYGYGYQGSLDFEYPNSWGGDGTFENLWSMDDIWSVQQQL